MLGPDSCAFDIRLFLTAATAGHQEAARPSRTHLAWGVLLSHGFGARLNLHFGRVDSPLARHCDHGG